MSAHTSRPLVVAAVMASMAMIALEATIVSTAMPQIVADLGGLRLYSWVFSSFLLAQTAMTVVFGKLSDLFGRKPAMLAGIAIFLVGSVGAGFAWSMPVMIVFRLIQGVGAGAIQPITMTIVGDLYPLEERGRVQGWLSSVWALSAVLGPVVGGLIIHDLTWAWIFWLNVPIGIAAAIGFVLYLHEHERHEKPSIDYTGAALFTVAIGAFMMAVTDFSAGSAASDARAWIETVVCVIGGALFAWQERRVADPMISFALWSLRPIAAANAGTVCVGMVMMGLTTFLPMYVQGVLQRSPVVAGLALTMMLVGWPFGAFVAARSLRRFGINRLLTVGSIFIPLGTAAFLLLKPGWSPLVAALGSLVLGLGMGLSSITSLVLVQSMVDGAQRGSATASNLFSRNLGSTLGATVFGAVLNYGLAHANVQPAIDADQLRQLLDLGSGTVAAAQPVRDALQHALHLTFVAMFAVAAAVVVAMRCVPHVRVGQVNVSVNAGEAV